MLLLNYFIIVIIIKMIEQCNICIEDFSKQKERVLNVSTASLLHAKNVLKKWI